MDSSAPGVAKRGSRLLFVQHKPSQIDSALFRELAALHVPLTVHYQSVEPVHDPEMSRLLDLGPILDGYAWSLEEPELSDAHAVVEGWSTRWAWGILARGRADGSASIGLRFDTVGQSPGRRALHSLVSESRQRVALALANVWHPTGSASLAYAQGVSGRTREVVPIPYAVDAREFRGDGRFASGDRLRVLVVSKLNEREGVADIVSAVGRLPFVDLTVVGDGVLRSDLERTSSSWKSRVRFEGYVPYPKLPAFYRKADVFVHAAHWEPWGVSIQEALLSHTAVIASRAVESSRDLMPGELGHWLFDAGDIDRIAELLIELRSSEAREMLLASAVPRAVALSSQVTAARIARWFDSVQI